MSNQFIRKVSLIVYGNPPTPVSNTPYIVPVNNAQTLLIQKPSPAANTPALDLSQFRIVFNVSAIDIDTPPTATIRIINLSDQTANTIVKEFSKVVLQAGYENGNFGIIFQGDIIRIRKGRLSNIDTFLDIMASNLDAFFNWGAVATSIPAGATNQDKINAVKNAYNNSPITQQASSISGQINIGQTPGEVGVGGVLPRGKVLMGMAANKYTDIANSQGWTWQIGPDGVINFVELNRYLPSNPVPINAATGMIGIPELTPQGLEVKTLLNPLIKCGTRIQLNNATINMTQTDQFIGFPAISDFQYYANASADGIYRVFVAEHEGDVRGEGADWTTSIVALAVDQTTGTVSRY